MPPASPAYRVLLFPSRQFMTVFLLHYSRYSGADDGILRWSTHFAPSTSTAPSVDVAAHFLAVESRGHGYLERSCDFFFRSVRVLVMPLCGEDHMHIDHHMALRFPAQLPWLSLPDLLNALRVNALIRTVWVLLRNVIPVLKCCTQSILHCCQLQAVQD